MKVRIYDTVVAIFPLVVLLEFAFCTYLLVVRG